MKVRQVLTALSVLSMLALSQGALAEQAARPYDKTFLTNYGLLKPRVGKAGAPGDMGYVAPNAVKRLASYTAVMVDQPEIIFSPDSPIKGMKPDDQKALAEAMRDAISGRLAAGGYSVAQQPGPGVLYLRIGLTDLMVVKKKRGVLAYTPIGAVVKVGADAVKDTLSKVDFIEMTFQAELIDSTSDEVLGAIVAARGAREAKGQEETRIDLSEFDANVRAWGNRLRCQLDNSKLTEDRQHDCTDDAAALARYDEKN
jgi:hypothetical protein